MCVWSRLGASCRIASCYNQHPKLAINLCLTLPACLQGCRHGAMLRAPAYLLLPACCPLPAARSNSPGSAAVPSVRILLMHCAHCPYGWLQYPNQMLEITVRMYLYRWISRGEPGAIGAEYMQHNLQVGGGRKGRGEVFALAMPPASCPPTFAAVCERAPWKRAARALGSVPCLPSQLTHLPGVPSSCSAATPRARTGSTCGFRWRSATPSRPVSLGGGGEGEGEAVY